MKKKFIILLLILLLVGIVGGTIFLWKTNDKKDKSSNSSSNVEEVSVPDEKVDEIALKVEETMKNMTLEEKIAQMIIIEYRNPTLSSEFVKMLSTYHPGGFILFGQNMSTYNQTLNLVKDIQSTATIPMFIGVDEEGGSVQRLTKLTDIKVANMPAMSRLGKLNDSEVAYDVGVAMALQLRALGINVDFAPVLDVKINEKAYIGTRSFGTDPELVSKLGLAVAKGLTDNGVIAVYKHFPGHGSTTVDSHYDLPVLTKNKEELKASDWIPFQDAIEAGADIIMIGHLAVPTITNNKVPASLSKEIITDMLKGELGFDGLVITDALEMDAITKNYKEKEIYEMAINAGVDILLMPPSVESAITNIMKSIEEGKITEEQINESVRKILTLKYSKLNTEILPKENLDSSKYQDLLNKIPN